MPKRDTGTDISRRRQNTTGGRGRPYPNEIIRGVISDHDYVRMTYTVHANGQHIEGAVDVSGLCGSLIGFKQVNRLPVGTQVALLYGQPSWILSTAVLDQPDVNSFKSRTTTGKGVKKALDTLNPGKGEVPVQTPPEDLYQGEFEISNMLGTFVRFMTFMASMGSGERAKIEFHLLRDLVRIVSGNYEHFAAPGDIKMFNDGRLNTEIHGTTYEHERWGRQKPTDPKFESTDTGMPKSTDPMETGRWRYDFLLGFIGDLFNGWFSDPCDAVGRMAEGALRSGKARLHVGQDGTLLAQSCSEIILERVTRVQVPIRIKHEEDADGVLRKEMDELDTTFLKFWDQGKEDKEHHTLFKLREYVRYLNQYHSLARLHQLAAKKGEWKVPSEAESPAPTEGAGEDDRGKVAGTYWKDCFATIRIYRDGSTLVLDAYGNATATGPYGIQHSSTGHYHVYTAGDYVVKAGGSAYISALRHVEVVANRGALLLKARTGWRALCEVGTLWLKSDMNPDDGGYTPAADGDPTADRADRQGIRIQATQSESRWISALKTRFTVKRASENFELDAAGDAVVRVRGKLSLSVVEELILSVRNKIRLTATEWKSWIPGGFYIDKVCHFTPGLSLLSRIKTLGVISTGPIFGPKVSGIPVPKSSGPLRQHINHIHVYTGETKVDLVLPDSDKEEPDEPEEDAAGFSWSLLQPEEYSWKEDGAKNATSTLFEPLAQQTLRLDPHLFVDGGYDGWRGMADALRRAEQTATDTPWPGAGAKWLLHKPKLPSLHFPTGRDPSTFDPGCQTDLTSEAITFKFLKR